MQQYLIHPKKTTTRTSKKIHHKMFLPIMCFCFHKCFTWLHLVYPTFGFRGQILVALNPLHILFEFNVFFNARETHCTRSFFLTLFPLLARVQRSMYVLNVVLNDLNHATSRGCKTWLMCDGNFIKSNPNPLALCTISIVVTCELWPSISNK
jgi:hypothetical protein